MSLARVLYDLFFSLCTHYALGNVKPNGEVYYTPTEGVPTLALIEQHLRGEIVLGAYAVLPGSVVRWLAFDVDSKANPEKAKEIVLLIHAYLGKIPHVVEWSGNKGYHILIFFADTHSAKDVKRIGETIRSACGLAASGDPHVEVYPKQGQITEAHPLGSLLRLPMGVHPGTKKHTKFVDPDNDWAEVEPETALALRGSVRDLEKIAQGKGGIERLVDLFSEYWASGQRHDMALHTAGYLSSLGWEEEDVQDLVEDIYEKVGDGDPEDWKRAVKDTFIKVYAGETVAGLHALAKVIPADVMREISEIAGGLTSSVAIQMIDNIRLGKGAAWQKVRLAARTVVSYFRENGKLVKDINRAYWLNNETKKLIQVGGSDWDLVTHNIFGLNGLESFGRQTIESVRLFAQGEAEMLSVYKRSHWDPIAGLLYLNLGGSEVIIFNGKPSERRYTVNGDNKVLFLNSTDPLNIPSLQEDVSVAIDPWTYLVDDFHFEVGDKVHATAQEQKELIKALILSIFFSEIIPARPILAMLGEHGIGKTTSARRLLWFLEGLQADVVTVNDDKPDSLRASLAAHKVLCLDNLEKSTARWLPDMLNRASTGANIELRVLHTTNKVETIRPDCNLIITATSLPFAEETVFSRMLPVQLGLPPARKGETLIKAQLNDNQNALWKGMFDVLDMIVAELNSGKPVNVTSDTRLADFAIFCTRIQDAACINGKALISGLNNLTSRQKTVLSDTSAFIAPLEYLLKTSAAEMQKWMNGGELFSKTQRVTTQLRLPYPWTNAQGLSRHVLMLEPYLAENYGLDVRKIREGNREVKMYRFLPEKIVLDNSSEKFN